MSITSLPEFSYGSNEEIRLADFERKKTGNIKFFLKLKIKKLTKIFLGTIIIPIYLIIIIIYFLEILKILTEIFKEIYLIIILK